MSKLFFPNSFAKRTWNNGAWLLSEPKRTLRPRGAEREHTENRNNHANRTKKKRKTDHGWSWHIQPCWQSSRCILGAMSQKIARVSHHSTSSYPTWLCTMAYVPGSKLLILGMVIPPLIGNPHNWYIKPCYKVDDHSYHRKTMGV